MAGRLKAVFLDIATLGPDVDTWALDECVDVEYFQQSDSATLAGRVAGADIAIVNKVRLDRDTIVRSDRLKLIVLAATGADNVDLEAAREREVPVLNIRDYCTSSVVQHVFALILALTRRIAEYQAVVRAGAWQRSDTFTLFTHTIRELDGKTLGVVGYGSLGRAVGEAAPFLGLKVSISARPGTPSAAVPRGRVPFEELLEHADVLTLHCPLSEENRGLIGSAELARMKSDALLINTARGALVDSRALVDALSSGEIGGAGIDVLPVEPPTGAEPLLAAGIPNLILTPHIAWTARESRQRALDKVVENVRDFLAGGDLRRKL